MRVPIIPSWCKGLPNTTRLTTADILEFFEYPDSPCNSANANKYLSKGYLPEPVRSKRGSVGAMNKRDKYWLLGDIRKLRVDMLTEKQD